LPLPCYIGHVISIAFAAANAFLNPLRQIVESGLSPAQVLLGKYEKEWGGDLSRVYDDMSF
jgi:gamma-glutamylcysteine synthetase